MDIFNASPGNKSNAKINIFEELYEKVMGKIVKVSEYAESKLYGDLYEGKYAKQGNNDAA